MASTTSRQDKASNLGFQLAFILCGVQVFVLLASWRSLPPQLPLFYSRPWGEEQLTTPLGILILPGLSIGIILVNLVLGWLVNKKEVLVKQILSSASALFSFLCLVTLIQIIRLVI